MTVAADMVCPEASTSLVAAHAIERTLIGFEEEGVGDPDDLSDLTSFCSPSGFDEVRAIDRKCTKAG